MITTKDLNYLSDMFNWNLNSYKIVSLYYDSIEDNKLRKHLDCALNTLYDCMDEILLILGGNDE